MPVRCLTSAAAGPKRGHTPYEDNLRAIAHLGDVQRDLVAVSDAVHDTALSGEPAGDELRASLAELDAGLDASWEKYLATDPQGMEAATAAFTAAIGDYRAIRDDQLLPLMGAASSEEVITTMQDGLGEPEDTALEALADITTDEIAAADASLAASRADYRSDRTLTVVLLVLATGLAIAIALGVGRLIGRPLQQTVDMLEEVASGRLDHRLEVDTADEVGRMGTALNATIARLGAMMAQMDHNAHSLASASEELSAVSGQMSGSAADASVQAAAGSTNEAADELARMAAEMRSLVGQFQY